MQAVAGVSAGFEDQVKPLVLDLFCGLGDCPPSHVMRCTGSYQVPQPPAPEKRKAMRLKDWLDFKSFSPLERGHLFELVAAIRSGDVTIEKGDK